MSAARTIAYRPEIDGLRAVAVMMVILYHGLIPGFGAGYIGVDIFFVISGYLITGILTAELAEGRFSILRFYERRIRRIIPALMLVMLLCVPFALWLMLPDDLENFGQSLIATTAFANNILMLMTSGYFETEVQFKPLMHTWSLGVEEQYYLAVPLMMWAAWAWGKTRGVVTGIAAVTVLSFATCIVLARYAPQADFFLIFSRGWELGAGSLAVLLEPRIRPLAGKRTAAALVLFGLLLAVSPFLYRYTVATPNWRTALSMAGICLILLFGGRDDPAGRVLASKPFVGIGLISYSAYLFHQPIFAFVRLASLDQPSVALMLGLLVPILLCAWLSWRFVEQPCRDRSRVSTRKLLIGSLAAALVTIAVGATFQLTSGFYQRWPELADQKARGRFANIEYNLGPERFEKVSLPASSDKVRVLVIGSSFARDFINMALETGRVGNHIFALRARADCEVLKAEEIEQARNADFIVLASRPSPGQVRCIARRIKRLSGLTSAQIIIIGRKSFGYNNNAIMRLPAAQRIDWRVLPLAEALAANAAARRALPPESYVDVIGMLSDARGRVRVFTPEGRFISQDREHLTRPGAIYVGAIIFRHPALQALLDARPAHPPR
jgi:peptidoglycan/LPS O-acetylase OafA/YrhL